jgi:homoserine kinase type II
MAVFTPVSVDQAQAWLADFDVGRLIGFEGIASGIENSNFFVTTERGRYVLTLFERLTRPQLPFYLGFMKHLAHHAIPCPDPVADRHDRILGELHGKPAALVTRLPGSANMNPAPVHCSQVGGVLARMHLAALDYPDVQPNLRGLAWWGDAMREVLPFLGADSAGMLGDEFDAQQRFAGQPSCHALPRTAVHADLFRDNVLFEPASLGGVIDFYFAGVDTWMFDLAVTCNDWCIDEASGDFVASRLDALLGGYRAVRMPSAAEIAAWPMMLRAAALRFWLSRLYDLYLPRPAQMVTPKDPALLERVLRSRRRGAPAFA